MKALEAYRIIFDVTGPTNLAKHMHLYSVGLYPLMAYAQIRVKKELLAIYQSYMLSLPSVALQPLCHGLLHALLPGLEEGSDFYDV